MRALVVRSASEIGASDAGVAGGVGGVEDVMSGVGTLRKPKGRLTALNAQAPVLPEIGATEGFVVTGSVHDPRVAQHDHRRIQDDTRPLRNSVTT
jgi:hypothetical protein